MTSLFYLEAGLSIVLVALAVWLVFSQSLIKKIIALSGLSMLAAVAFMLLMAPDVAMTEIVIGSGLLTFLFLFVLKSDQKAGGSR